MNNMEHAIPDATEEADLSSNTTKIAALVLDDPVTNSSESSDTDDNSESKTLSNITPSAHDYKSHFSYVNSDSSDIEVLLETTSSDSIEVLEPSYLQRQDTVVESKDETSVTDTCSDSPTLLSNNSSACTTDESKNNSPKVQCPEAEDGNQRPDSLVLPKPLQYYERLSKKDSFSSVSSRSSSMDALLETPLSMHGTLSKDGDMLSFVAEGLTDMIKRSSPMSRSRTASSVSSWSVGPSGAQTPSAHSISSLDSSTSGWDSSASSVTGYSYSGLSSKKQKRMMKLNEALQGSSRSASELTQSPDDIPPIDPRAIMDLELFAEKTAESLHLMMSTLSTDLHKMSSLTHACLGAYAEGVDNTCDVVDSSIKSMYALMAKCEELNSSLRPIYGLQEQIRGIKKLLDMFETQMAKSEKTS